ncbi:MAG: menaquinone reductase multiheme cytochrome c subunit QrcA [Thermodesulfobacteriota bacterium]|nr:menaquinone reductase multiheme cytochrome c subunit QrcA [Thermodesulfobacteriota bacterium]
MSATKEEKEQTVAEGAQEEANAEHAQGEAEHEPVAKGTWRFLIPLAAFFVGFVSHFVVGWVALPVLLYAEKQQPIDFNHELHAEELGECEGCHYFREDGSFSGVPKLDNCLECHEEVMGESAEEAKFVAEYVEPGKEVPWLIYSRQPVCVFFSHAAHVNMAEIECVICHGSVGDSKHTRPYQYNRLTKYSRDIWGRNIAGLTVNGWERLNRDESDGPHAKEVEMDGPARMKMDDCAKCHEGHKGKGYKDACFVCHK